MFRSDGRLVGYMNNHLEPAASAVSDLELSQLDLLYEGYRLRQPRLEAVLLSAIAREGIREPLLGVRRDTTPIVLFSAWVSPSMITAAGSAAPTCCRSQACSAGWSSASSCMRAAIFFFIFFSFLVLWPKGIRCQGLWNCFIGF